MRAGALEDRPPTGPSPFDAEPPTSTADLQRPEDDEKEVANKRAEKRIGIAPQIPQGTKPQNCFFPPVETKLKRSPLKKGRAIEEFKIL